MSLLPQQNHFKRNDRNCKILEGSLFCSGFLFWKKYIVMKIFFGICWNCSVSLRWKRKKYSVLLPFRLIMIQVVTLFILGMFCLIWLFTLRQLRESAPNNQCIFWRTFGNFWDWSFFLFLQRIYAGFKSRPEIVDMTIKIMRVGARIKTLSNF